MHVEQTRLPGGLRVLTSRLVGFESMAVMVFVRTGSRMETAEQGGVAHFLEHLAFKGTANRTALQIAARIESLGANVNAFTSKEMTAYYVGGLRRHVPEAVAILGDVLTSSLFAETDVATERGVVLQEIRQYRDSPGAVAGQAVWNTAFPDQAIGRPVLGDAAFIGRIARDDVTGFVAKHYFAENMIVVGAGDFDHSGFAELVGEHFGALPHRGAAETPEPARYVGGACHAEPDRFGQATVMLTLPSVPEAHPDGHAHGFLAAAIGGGLSSPLFQEVRQKRGLAYSIQAFGERGSDFGMLTVSAGTTAEHVPELLRLVCEELLRATRGIADDDMARARNQALARLATIFESPFRVARTIAWGLFTRDQVVTPAQLMAEAEAVTPDHVRAAAEMVAAGVPTLCSAGPVGEGDHYGVVRAGLGTPNHDAE